jgi:hypothetical protein
MLVAVGLVWIGQGVGLLQGSSFMVDDQRWAWIGAGTAIAGLVLGWLGWRGRPRPGA